MALPHAEDVLAALVNVDIAVGAKDLVCHLEGATMRTGVVLALIEELRSSGYPGYAADINASEAVRQRVQEMYVDKYGEGPFVSCQKRCAMLQRLHTRERCQVSRSFT